MKVTLDKQSALIVVDVQNDFCPGGALPVAEGDRVVPVLNRYIEVFRRRGAPIFATRDWHPANHCSFKSHGGSWPAHCVQDTLGAAFHPDLRMPPDTIVISKASDPDADAYSGFAGTDLCARLRALGVRRVFVGGLATDYCVKSTVLDALREGFEVFWLSDASRGVDVYPDDSQRAIEEMLQKGAHSVTLEQIEQ